MLTEADMVRIMAAKYRLAESVVEEDYSDESFSDQSLDVLSGSDSFEESGYDMQDSTEYFDDILYEGSGG